MVISHNIAASNANRTLGLVTGALASADEKLSSGYRINRAGDDAAGLSISEKMRAQIRGLNKASTNTSDGISLLQTAEGALNETHSILQRMNELATQAANDTNTTDDRSQIQKEIDQLVSEIDRISSTTQFNTMNLIDGSFTSKQLQVGALSGQNIQVDIDNMDAQALGLRAGTGTQTVTTYQTVNVSNQETGGNGATASSNDSSVTLTITDASKITRDVTLHYEPQRLVSHGASGAGSDPNNAAITTNVLIATAGAHAMPGLTNLTSGSGTIRYWAEGAEVVSAANNNGVALSAPREGWYGVTGSSGSYSLNYIDPSYVTVTGGTLTAGTTTANAPYVNVDTYGLYYSGWAESPTGTLYVDNLPAGHIYNASTPASMEDTFGVQYSFPGINPALGASAWITLNTPSTAASNTTGTTSVATTGTQTVSTNGISVMSHSLASDAMSRIQSATDIVSEQRGKLGALQNRLEHTIANLNNTSENTSAAESRIRDADMAEEMQKHSKNQIIAQAGQSMLAQANQSKQGVTAILG